MEKTLRAAKPGLTDAGQPVDLLFLAAMAVFFLSGATSLVYQVIWVRMLSLFFGSDVYAAAITLSVFMGGLAFGSWLSGRLADRAARPLLFYGLCEVGIAACAFAFPHVLAALGPLYKTVYTTYFATDPAVYHGFRAATAAAALFLPTALMGATLPLMVRQFVTRSDKLGNRVGLFYSANTIGALAGTLLTGFLLLPALGVKSTVGIAVAANLLIGLAAVLAGWRVAPPRAAPAEATGGAALKPMAAVVVVVMAVSGFAALALEVVWMRILVQSFSATVYAFSIMLATFLFGIYYGSRKVAALVDEHHAPLRLLVILELALAAYVATLGILAHAAPATFGTLVWTLTALTGGGFAVSSIAAQFIVASALIVFPTILLGATFPVAVKAFTRSIESRAAGTGAIYAANTAGALLGALFGGFVLLPLLGARHSLIVIAGLFLLAGLVLARAQGPSEARGLHVAVLPAVFALASVGLLLLPQQTVVNFNLQKSSAPDVLYHGEGVAHTVDILRNDKGNTIMMVNGNIEADTTLTQRRHFILKGHMPLVLHPQPRRVAVVGLGLGVTLRATANHPTVSHIQLIELTPEMVAAHRALPALAGNVLASPKLHLRVDDGRNFMSMAGDTYDMITADPIHPRITGVGYLYTREYYEAIKKRLSPGGIVVQWMPMYQLSPESFDVAFRTFARVFPNASFWYVRFHGLFVATVEGAPIDYAKVVERLRHPAVDADLASVGMRAPEEFFSYLLMDAEHIRKYVARTPSRQLNTDDNAYLEYRTPFEFLGGTRDIVGELLPYAGVDYAKLLRHAAPEDEQRLRAAWKQRLARIIPELSEPVD
jgi:spermidine synthase